MCRGSQEILYCGCSAALAKSPQLTGTTRHENPFTDMLRHRRRALLKTIYSSTISTHRVAQVLLSKSKFVGELQLKGHAGHDQGMHHQKAHLLNGLAGRKARMTIIALRLDSLLMYTTGTEAPSHDCW